jgi:hypothetical protein
MIDDDRLPLKEQFLEYYSQMPIKKYAGFSIGRSEDTIKRWEDEDADFADRINKAKADYLLKKSRNLAPSFIIPLLFRDLTPRVEQEITIYDKLDDDKLNRLIQQKARKLGIVGATAGEGEADSGESA